MSNTFARRLRTGVVCGCLATTTLAAGCSVSRQQEVELGRQYAAEINRQLPIVEDGRLTRYLDRLGEQIAAHTERKFDYRFFIVNAEDVNAFAVPGGYVYINRGLIEQTESMSELAGVLAHEIGHVELRHSAEQLERMQTANVGLTLAYVLMGRQPSGVEEAAINVGGSAVFANYSRGAEKEADELAVPLLVEAGIDPRGLVSFFEVLMEQRQRSPSSIEQWFSTHPLTEDRIRDARRRIDRIPPSRLQNLQRTSESYRDFVRRMRRYPAPPERSRR